MSPARRRTIPATLIALALAAVAALAPVATHAAGPDITATAVTWTFADAGAPAWTAERGRATVDNGALLLRPDTSRRVMLVSPSAVPADVGNATAFLLGVEGTGLQRVRIQGRRDARGGWITLADASGNALRQAADGVVVTRKAGVRDGPIERLRIEIIFRTTNPRTLTRVSALRQ